MKVWRKTRTANFGSLLFVWHTKASSKFFVKIFTWLLSAFVFGILTSIALAWLGFEQYALTGARIVFFATFVAGIFSAYVQHVVEGLEYRIYSSALVHVKPFAGSRTVAKRLSKNADRGAKYEFIPWSLIQSFDIKEENLIIELKEEQGSVSMEITPLNDYGKVSEQGVDFAKADANNWKLYDSDQAFSEKGARIIVSALREAKRSNKS